MLNSTMNVELIAIIIAAPSTLVGVVTTFYLAKAAFVKASAEKAAAEAAEDTATTEAEDKGS